MRSHFYARIRGIHIHVLVLSSNLHMCTGTCAARGTRFRYARRLESQEGYSRFLHAYTFAHINPFACAHFEHFYVRIFCTGGSLCSRHEETVLNFHGVFFLFLHMLYLNTIYFFNPPSPLEVHKGEL
eukprot:XP_002260994.1 hypothetical protein PKH_031120 [Plasmodium knowlesi strain H]